MCDQSTGSRSAASTDWSDREQQLLQRAYEAGYFETPRAVSLVDLADEFGYDSDEASVALRRALRQCLADCLE
jgi:predicted DNA binding protein